MIAGQRMGVVGINASEVAKTANGYTSKGGVTFVGECAETARRED